MEKIYELSQKIITFCLSASAVLLIFIAYAELSDIMASAATEGAKETVEKQVKPEEQNKSQPQAKAAPAANGGFSVKVEAIEATEEATEDNIKTVGNILSSESVEIKPEISGKIAKINFINGSAVEANQTLFEIDNSVQLAELNKAKANENLVANNVNRFSKLVKSGAVSKTQLDEAIAQLRVARAETEYATAMLEKTRIKAPFAGIVGIRKVSYGDYVTAGELLVDIDQVSPLKIHFSIPEKYIDKFAIDSEIKFQNSSQPDKLFTAKITSVDSRISETNRGINIEAITMNEESLLFPGQFVTVTLPLGKKRNSILIPSQSVVSFGKKNYVFKVVNGVAEKYEVTLGKRTIDKVEILEGVMAGETVVTAGHQKLQHGVPVRVIEPLFVKLNFMNEEQKIND
jgi:membrane fusion protein (multidrug efflux system)